MRIIDIHVHIYDKVAGITKGAPITGEDYGKAKIGNHYVQFIPPSFEKTRSSAEMLLAHMDWCGVEKALLMANPLYGYTNDYFLDAVKKYPDRFRGVALVDFLKGKEAAEELAWIYDNTQLFGFKIESDSTFQCAPHKHMADEEFAPVWDVCSQYRQPVFLHMFTDRDVRDMMKLAETYPQISFIICHMGADSCFRKNCDPGNFDALLEFMKDHGNVWLDTSSVPSYFTEEYPFPSSVRIVEKAYSLLGPERLMWASDYPGMMKLGTYKELIGYVMNHTNIPEADMELIMGENAQRMFFDS